MAERKPIRSDRVRFPVVCPVCKTEFTIEKRSLKAENICQSCRTKMMNQVHNAPRWFVRRWYDIQRRCLDESNRAYKDYGGRGITCEFSDCSEMWAYMRDLPNCSSKLTIDRINNDGNYERGNLRWIPKGEQVANRRVSDKRKSVLRLLATTSLLKQAIYKKFSEGMTEQEIRDEWLMFDRLAKSTSFSNQAIAQYLNSGMSETEIKERSDAIDRLLRATTFTRERIVARFSKGYSEAKILSLFKKRN